MFLELEQNYPKFGRSLKIRHSVCFPLSKEWGNISEKYSVVYLPNLLSYQSKNFNIG